MSPSFLNEHAPYFFNQRTDRRFQRRFRKILDDVSLYGEKRDLHTPDRERVASALPKHGFTRAISARPRSSTGKRVALSNKVVVLPPVDKDGPRLVSEAAETKFEGKQLSSVQGGEEPRSGWTKVKEIYKYDELKFGSTAILSNLEKLFSSALLKELGVFTDKLDQDLLHKFLRDYHSLTADTVVEKREWQTDCYLDLGVKNRHPFLTAPPEEGEEEGSDDRKKANEAILTISKRNAQQLDPSLAVKSKVVESKQNKEKGKYSTKRVTMSEEVTSKFSPVERPQTARSILSSVSFHSDYSRASNDSHYDELPAEFGPNIMSYKRESMAPKVKVKGPRTRLEKFRDQASQNRHHLPHYRPKKPTRPEVQVSQSKIGGRPSTATDLQSPSRTLSRPTSVAQRSTDIKITLTDSDLHEKGWLVHAAVTEDPEMATILLWEKKAKERLRKREEEKMIAKQQSADGPLVVKFYSNPQTRNLHAKHQRSATFPLPTVLSKLPPSVANFTTPGVASGDVMMIGEGPELAVLIHPDGSGHANYYSKHGQRQAVCQSRTDIDTKGLYTVAYDDTESHPVLACFSPLGKGWCYYPGSGALHMYYDSTELRIYSEDGHIIKRSPWFSDKVTVTIQLNPCLSFHCNGIGSMVLRFSCRGQAHKFDVSPSAPLVTHQSPGLKAEDSSIILQSGLEFISNAAHACRRAISPPPAPKPKPKAKKTLKRNRSLTEGAGGRVSQRSVNHMWDEEEEARARQAAANLDILEKNLEGYRERIKSTVNGWMSRYRQEIGISLPAHLRTPFSHSPSPPHSAFTRHLLYSSKSYAGEVDHSRPVSQPHFYTHPLPSRVTSPIRGQSASHYGIAVEIAQDHDILTTPPPATPLPTTPTPALTFDHIVRPMSEGKSVKDRRKSRRNSSNSSKKCGCPVALHKLLLNNEDTMPPCKCDKRRPPYICDLEYDVFLRSHVPRTQVVVVCVLSSVQEGSCPCEPMLDALHYNINRQRFSPCTQSYADKYRVVKYDLGHSLSGTKRTTPLLVERHRAWPGMFLMYVGGHLIHADYVFNGYGTTKRDFLKQIQQCLHDASKGRYLPSDYQFTANTGGKSLHSTSWAYPLTGVLEFLVPYSLPSSSQTSVPETPSEDDEEMPPQPSGRRSLLSSGLDLSHLQALSQLSRSRE